jgi:hypothetical protein
MASSAGMSSVPASSILLATITSRVSRRPQGYRRSSPVCRISHQPPSSWERLRRCRQVLGFFFGAPFTESVLVGIQDFSLSSFWSLELAPKMRTSCSLFPMGLLSWPLLRLSFWSPWRRTERNLLWSFSCLFQPDPGPGRLTLMSLHGLFPPLDLHSSPVLFLGSPSSSSGPHVVGSLASFSPRVT